MKISKVRALEVLDSRGNPTVMCEIWAGDFVGRAVVPSGASTGEHEAHEQRDKDMGRYHGKGVLQAVSNVNNVIGPKIKGKFLVTDQQRIDKFLQKIDGSENKSLLGANAILAVSMAASHCAATALGIPLYQYFANTNKELCEANKTPACGPNTERSKNMGKLLPVPMMNIINGGAHGDNKLDIQEFMIMPRSAKTCTDAIRMGSEVFHSLKKVLKERGFSTNVGDEGGFAPNLSSNKEALDMVMLAIKEAHYKPGEDICIALDVAASEFFDTKQGKYIFEGKPYSTEQMIDYYENLVKTYPIVSIEDGLDQNDWTGYSEFTKRLGGKIQIMGDDFFCTNPKRLIKGINGGACNSILIKLNQIGTVSETLECIKLAHDAGFTTIISHRSGETEDTTIADLAVGVGAGQIKTGSLSRTDRTAKYNRLMYIESEIKKPLFKYPFK